VVFADTNIFLYAISTAPEERAKRDRAARILHEESWAWSVQVAGEFVHNATSPRRPFRLSNAEASEYLRVWFEFPTAAIEPATVLTAMEIRQRHSIAYWDSLILASAGEMGCRTLYSEDFAHGRLYDGIRVVNPFQDLTDA
jgi:predicted nucleic acid-binding protein